MVGRRGGKSPRDGDAGLLHRRLVQASARCAASAACCCASRPISVRQPSCSTTRVAAFEASPILKQLIANRTSDTLELTNGISIEVRCVVVPSAARTDATSR